MTLRVCTKVCKTREVFVWKLTMLVIVLLFPTGECGRDCFTERRKDMCDSHPLPKKNKSIVPLLRCMFLQVFFPSSNLELLSFQEQAGSPGFMLPVVF